MATDLEEREDLNGDEQSRDSIPGLVNQEQGGDGFNSAFNKTPNNAYTPGSLRDQEENPSLFNPKGDNKPANVFNGSGAGALAEKGLFTAAEAAAGPAGAALQIAQGIRGLLSGNRGKGAAGIVGIIVSILIIIGGFNALVSGELIHIEKVLLKDVSAIEQRYEKKAAQKVFQSILDRAAKKAAAKLKGTKAPADGTGELAQTIDNFDITDPQVIDSLSKAGITVELDSQGGFAGLKDSTGADITESVGTNDAVFNEVEAGLPEWNVGQLESFRSLMIDHAQASFSAIPEDTAPENVDKVIRGAVEEGSTATDLANVAEETASETPTGEVPLDSNGKPVTTDATASAQASGEGGALSDVLKTTTDAINNGATNEAAVQAGADSFNLGTPLLASSIATTLCSFKSGVDQASNSRVPTITKLLIRHMTLLVSMADEIKNGKIKAGNVNKIMQIFNGNSAATATATNPNPQEALPFTSSAAWQRMSGNPITNTTDPKGSGYTPDINKSSLPSKSAGSKIVDSVDNITSATGLNFGCKALTSPFGFVIQTGLGIAQVFGDIGSFGTAQIAITGGIIAVQESLQRIVLPEVIKYFLPVGVNGLENSVQWMNNAHVGGILSFNDYGRRLGAAPVGAQETQQLVMAANADRLQQDARMSWSQRTLAIDNPDSLVSRVALTLPISGGQAMAHFANFFTTIPSSIVRTFGSLVFMRKAAALDQATNPETAYGITQYAFNDNEVSKYPIVDNENYLQTTVSYTNSAGAVTTMKRIDMAGDPNKFEAVSNNDPDTTDLLHCFVNSFADQSNTGPANETGPDPICGTMGNYDYSQVTPQAMTDADNVTVAYCDHLAGSATPDCVSQVTSQLHDDIGHFRQYILNVHAAHDYTSLAKQS